MKQKIEYKTLQQEVWFNLSCQFLILWFNVISFLQFQLQNKPIYNFKLNFFLNII